MQGRTPVPTGRDGSQGLSLISFRAEDGEHLASSKSKPGQAPDPAEG